MEKYDYKEAVMDDVREYIDDHYTNKKLHKELRDKDDFANRLYDDLFCEDSVTGNASGSYTFNTWQAEENLCHNMDLLSEALTEFGCDASYMKEKGAEACDVTIRCYLLSGCISKVLDELEEESDNDNNEE